MKEIRNKITSAMEASQRDSLTEMARIPDGLTYGVEFREMTEQDYAIQLRNLATLLHSDFGPDKPDNIIASKDKDGTILINRLFNSTPIPWRPFSYPQWQLFTVQITPENRLRTSKDTQIGDEGLSEELKGREYFLGEDERHISSFPMHKELSGLDPDDESFLVSLSHIEKLTNYMQNKLLVKTAHEHGASDIEINTREGNLIQTYPPREGQEIGITMAIGSKRSKELIPIFMEACLSNPDAMSGATFSLEMVRKSDHSRPAGEPSLQDALKNNGLLTLSARANLKLGKPNIPLAHGHSLISSGGYNKLRFSAPITS